MKEIELWVLKTEYGLLDRATLEKAWSDGWWVDMGRLHIWYKRKANAEKFLKRCGYEREEKE